MNKFPFLTCVITRKCNLSCAYCDVSKKDKLVLSGDKWCKILDKFLPWTDFFNIIGGEIMLHPDLKQIIYHMASHRFPFSITTNAVYGFLSDYDMLLNMGVKSIGVSIDSLTNKGPDMSSNLKSKRGLSLAYHIREKHPLIDVIAITVVTDLNINEIPAMLTTFKSKGILSILCPVQSRDGLIASSEVKGITKTSELLFLTEWILQNYDHLSLIDPIEYFQDWPVYAQKGNWKCKTVQNPLIDSDGEIYPCMDISEPLNVNAIDAFDIENLVGKMRSAIGNCSGCFWNCTYVAELAKIKGIKQMFV
jgi:MoaA/NifB/PqqE/SkfB family radical SAM enzyme